MFSKKPLMRIKDFKSNKEDKINIDLLVDNLITKKTINYQFFPLKKSNNLKIISDLFKKKIVKRALSGFILILVLFALWGSSITSTYEDIGLDTIVTLEPRAVYNGDTIQINVSIPNYYNISSLKAEIDGKDIVDLFLLDNQSDYHFWTGKWIVEGKLPGYHITKIYTENIENITYLSSVEWKVLDFEKNENDSLNNASDTNGTISENEIPDNIDNDTNDSTDENISDEEEKSVNVNKPEDFTKAFDKFELPENCFGPSSLKIINMTYFWDYFNKNSNWYLETFDQTKNVWVNVSDSLIIDKNKSENNQYEKVSLEFTAPITGDYRLTFTIDKPLKSYVNNSNKFVYNLVYSIGENDEYSTYFDYSDIAKLPEIFINNGIKIFNGNEYFWFSVQKNNIPVGANVILDPTFGNTGTSATTTTIENNIKGGYFQMGANTGYGTSITAYLAYSPNPKNAKCALYNSSKVLVTNSMTEEKALTTGWVTFNFGSTKPILNANEWYYITVWGSSNTGVGQLYYATSGGSGVFSDNEIYSSGSYIGFPSPFEGSTIDIDGLASIYCTYYETTPPTPDPLTWVTEPYNVSSSSITMVATTASDLTTPISYYFNETTGASGGTDSGWQASTTYTDSGLSENTNYGYEVKARDSNSTPNEGNYSTPVSYEYTDVDPPTDNELTFLIGASWINASVAQPPNPTSGSTGSYFNWVTGGANNSGWQKGIYYHNRTGLAENTQYGTRVCYRNGDGDACTYNPTEKTNYTYCEPPTDGEFTIDSYGNNYINMSVLNPTNPTTGSTGAYFDCVTGGLSDSGWVNTSESGRYYYNFTGISNISTYGFKVKYRNADGVETTYTIEKQVSTGNTSVDPISPYYISTSPLTINATNTTSVDNVTLYYRWSSDNSSWGHSGETIYDTPTIDNTAASTSGVNVNSISWTHTVSSGLNNSILIVGVNIEDEDAGQNYYVASADFNNDALTRADRIAAVTVGMMSDISEIWYLLSPDAGSYTIRVNFSITVNNALGGSVSFSNVKQSAPYNTSTTANIASPTYIATSVNTEVANSLMIAVATDGQGTFVYSYGSGQTQIYDTASTTHEGAGSRKLSASSGSSTMYTNLSGATNRMSQVVAAWTPSSVTWGNGTNWAQWNNASNPDVLSPWSWNFNFPNGNGYYEFYSIGANNSYYESAPITADARCVYNKLPTITNEGPSNESINIQILPQMNITVNDYSGDPMTITWYSNSSGSWQAFGTNASVGNGTYHQTNNNFSNYYTTYWWYVNVSDGINTNTSGIFHFTTLAVVPTVYTNISTGVEETNATLYGYLQNNGGLETTCGFRFGTSSGVYSENYTKGTYSSNTEFSNNNGSLTPGQIYFYQAWAKNSIGFVNGSEMKFLTKPQPPTNLIVQQNNSSTMFLTWTKGIGANNTYIERNASGLTSWDRGQGTMIYNGSGNYYEDTGLAQGTKYYYQAWSYTTWTAVTTLQQWSDDNVSNSNTTNYRPIVEPITPTNGSTTTNLQPTCQIWANDTNGNTLTIDWYENTTGSWTLRQTNTSVSANSTVNWTFTQANAYGVTYWWRVAINDSIDNVTFWYYFTTNTLNTSVNSISPYVISTNPLTITATNNSPVDNVTLYYRWSDDNSSWGHTGETTYLTPTIDNTASEPNNVNVNSMSWTHTVSSGLNNSILIVGVNLEDNDFGDNYYVASADFNNDALTRAVRVAADEGTAAISEIWYLLSPDAGSYTVRVNFSVTINYALGGSVSFSNIKQSAPYNTNTAVDTGNPIGLTTSVNTEVANSLIIAVATDGNGDLSFSYGSGQTEIYDVAGTSHEGVASRKLSTAAGSSTMYTNLSAPSNRMSQVVATWTPPNVTWGNGTNWAVWSNSSNPDSIDPWSWGFDFPNGTGYYEFYSIGKKSGSTDESAPSSADSICRYNRMPIITNEVPANGSTNIQLIPQLNITVNDLDGDRMNVTWYCNSSGSWQIFGTNNSISNGTYYQTNSNFSSPGTMYWWYVSVYDGVHTNNSGIFYFTTSYKPVLSNPGPSNNSIGQYIMPNCNVTVSDADGGMVTVRFYENTTGSWILQQTNSSVVVTNPANVVWINYSNSTQDYTTYWWKVNVSDGKGCYAEEIYHFTTANTSIDITPARWDQGIVQVGSPNQTTGFYFNLTNNGDTSLYIQIKASNATNATTGAKWILNASSGYDNFTLQYNKSGVGVWTTINLTYDLFVSNLGVGAWQTFDLKLIMATMSSTSDPLSMDLTFRSIKA